MTKIMAIDPKDLSIYATVSIAFRVVTVYRIDLLDDGLGGMEFVEERCPEPYVKDYDALDEEGPETWPSRFDLRDWGLFVALDESRPVGGAAIALGPVIGATGSPEPPAGAAIAAGASGDTAILWDLRVAPDHRRRGVGQRLFQRAVRWAFHRNYRSVAIETQNVNVPACRFYARQGCRLAAVDRFGYAGVPDVSHEAMFLWRLDLPGIGGVNLLHSDAQEFK